MSELHKEHLTVPYFVSIIGIAWYGQAAVPVVARILMHEFFTGRGKNMKKAKKLFALVVLGGLGFCCGKLLEQEEVKDKLFEVLGEDKYLALESTVRLLGDLLMWPVHFVKALLP
jgi:hypothetical protein